MRTANLDVQIEYDLDFENEKQDHTLTIEDIPEISENYDVYNDDDDGEWTDPESSQSSRFSSHLKRQKKYVY